VKVPNAPISNRTLVCKYMKGLSSRFTVTISDTHTHTHTHNTLTDMAKAVQNLCFIADISKKIVGMSFIADGHVCIVGNAKSAAFASNAAAMGQRTL